MTVDRQSPLVANTFSFEVVADGVIIEKLTLPIGAVIIPRTGDLYELEQVDSHHKDDMLNGRHIKTLHVSQVKFDHTVVRTRKNGSVNSSLHQRVVIYGSFCVGN